MALSVVLISTSINGFEAVLNAVAILFVLEIDNWMYSLIKSNQYVEDELFDIKYEKHKEVTSYIIAKYQYMSNCCSCCKCQISSYLHKAEGDETFISLISLFVWFAMIMSFGLITLGRVYNEPDFIMIGFVALCVVCIYYVARYGFALIAGCLFKCQNRNKINDFITEELPRMIHIYVKKLDKEEHRKQCTSKAKLDQIQKIKEEYVDECFRYFDRNQCGVKDAPHETTEKFITAFDEYYEKCDKSKIQTTDLDFGAMALGIRFKL